MKMRKIVWTALSLAVLLFAFSTASASDPITGKWNFVLDTEGGSREFVADFKLDGEQVTGKFGPKADVKGTFKDQKIDLAFPVESEELSITDTLKITGKLENDALAGDWSFSQYSGTYKASKVK
jgi:hypothetical protein